MPKDVTFTCDGCARDVTGSPDAVVHVLNADVHRAEEAARREQPSSFTMQELLDEPDNVAHWQVHCNECNPHPSPEGEALCEGCYWFSLDRCDTAVKLLDWTAHLLEKNWTAATDWELVIRRAIGHVNA